MPKPPTIGQLFSTGVRKNSALGLRAFKLAAEREPSLEFLAFGHEHPSTELALPDGAVFHFRPTQSLIPKLYASCTAWLFCSETEGFGLPILEAMSCGTPVIAVNSAAAPDILEHGGGTLLKSFDPEEMAEAILRFAAMNEEEWQTESQSALKAAHTFTWEGSTDLFEAALQKAVTSTQQPSQR